jgi:ATP-dependent helicase/nuclease subunit B
LPYQASFEALAPAYLAWLAERERQGWQWADGETSRSAYPGVLQPQHLYGRLDRVDHGPGAQVQVVDYKTGASDPLKKSLRDPTEETQLAFYAALDASVQSALYLTLDEADSPVEISHPDVQAAAALMVPALASEMARLRAGAALPALGEGAVCDTCEARGLCRRDHWAEAS